MATTTGTRTTAKKAVKPTAPRGAAGGVKTAAKRTAAKRTAAKQAAAGAPAAAKKSAHHASDPSHYTNPELREQIKARILAGDKGGRPGQWSARKAQMVAHEYEAEGGGYTGGKSPEQQHLDQWTHEEWTTADGKPAIRGQTTARYLPKKAWDELTPAERRSTDKKKREASKAGQQFVANTGPAAAARRDATATKAAKTTAAKKPIAKKTTAAKTTAATKTGAKKTAATTAAKPPAATRARA